MRALVGVPPIPGMPALAGLLLALVGSLALACTLALRRRLTRRPVGRARHVDDEVQRLRRSGRGSSRRGRGAGRRCRRGRILDGREIALVDRSTEVGLVQGAEPRVVEGGVVSRRGNGGGRRRGSRCILVCVGRILSCVAGASSAACSCASAASSAASAASSGSAGTWARADWTPVRLTPLADGTTPIAIAASATAASTTSRVIMVCLHSFRAPAPPVTGRRREARMSGSPPPYGRVLGTPIGTRFQPIAKGAAGESTRRRPPQQVAGGVASVGPPPAWVPLPSSAVRGCGLASGSGRACGCGPAAYASVRACACWRLACAGWHSYAGVPCYRASRWACWAS